MIYFTLFLALNIATFNGLSCGADETEFKTLCVKTACMDLYNAALKTIDSSDGLGFIDKQFTPQTEYTSDGTIKVSISFKDSQDAGLLVLNNPISCIEINLFKRTDFTYSNQQPIPNQLTSKYDDSGNREISFEISDTNFDSQLIQDKSKQNEITFYGYFNLVFTISSEVVLTLRIQFQLTVDILQQISINKVQTLQLVKNDSNCDLDNTCITLVPSTLKYCSNQACTTYTDTLNLVVNEVAYVKQILDESFTSSFPSAFLDQPILFVRGTKMFHQIPVKSFTQLKNEGAILIEFSPDFVYSDVSLLVDSHVLINSQTLLSTQHLEPAHSVVQTSTLGCIFSDKTISVCPSCTEQEVYQTMTPECILKKMSCSSDETIVNGICMKESCMSNYQERVKTISLNSFIELDDKDLKVTFYFDDIELDGLTQKDNAGSCISSILNRYESLQYTQETLDKREITSTFNTQTNKREWVFYIQSNDFSKVLMIDKNNGTINYNGYFSYQFYVGTRVLLIYNFNFMIQQGSETSSSVVTSTTPRVIYGKATCNSENKCIQTASSSLKICKAEDCKETTDTKEYIINEDIFLIQNITHEGFLDWSLKLIDAEFKSTGLQRIVQGTQFSSGKGFIIIKLQASFAYSGKIKIVVRSELEPPGRRLLMNRILVTQSNAQANQESSDICIKQTPESKCESTDLPVSGQIILIIQLVIVMFLW